MKDIRGFSCFVILGGMVLVFCCITASAYASLQDPRLDYVPGEIIVSFEPSITESDVEDLANEFNFSVIRKLRLRQRNKYLIKVGDDQSEKDLISQLIQNADILRAKLNAIFRIPETWPSFPEVIYPMPTDDGGQISFEYLGDVEVGPDALFWQWYHRPEDILELIRVYIGPSGEIEPFEGFSLEGEITFVNRAFLEFSSFDVVSSVGELSSINVVPEPATLLLLGLGAVILRKRENKKAQFPEL